MDWTLRNEMKCNTSKCKEIICVVKKGCNEAFLPVQGIEQLNERTVLGVTVESNCKYSAHVKTKLWEANKCLYIIRSLRKEGYTALELDHLFSQFYFQNLLTHCLFMEQVSQILILCKGF